MFIFKQALIAALTVTLTVPSSFAQSTSQTGEAGEFDLNYTADSLVVSEKGSSETAVEFKFEASSPEELEKQSPDEINKMLQQMIAEAMQKKRQSNTSEVVMATLGHTAKSFIPESFKFALGLGVVAAADLWINYANNPVGLQQHIEHQMSPLGSMGFGLFILSNGLTTNILGPKFAKSPTFLKMLPYIGMIAGFMAQSVFSQIAADPNFVACARIHSGQEVSAEDYKNKGIDKKPCVTAWKNFQELRLAPSLISMMLSTYVSMKGQTWLTQFIRNNKATFLKVGDKVVKISKFELLLTASPGGVTVTSAKLVFKAGAYIVGRLAPIIAFTGLDMLVFNRFVTYHYQNFVDGNELYDVTERLVNQVNYMKSINWDLPAVQDAYDANSDDAWVHDYKNAKPGMIEKMLLLKKNWMNREAHKKLTLSEQILVFQKKMSAWRVTNISSVLQAHQNWTMALTRLTAMFGASHGFYTQMINAVRNHQFDLSPVKTINLQYPLWGVNPTGLNEMEKNAIVIAPKMYENKQKNTLKAVVAFMDQQNAQGKYSHLDINQRSQLAKLRNFLVSDNTEVLVKGLKFFKSELIQTFKADSIPFSSSSYAKYFEVLQEIRAILGDPAPQMEPGRGMLLAYETAPVMKEELKDVPFYTGVGYFATPRITDYLMMQMICGPNLDANEGVIKTTAGFPSIFLPPRLRTEGPEFKNECESPQAFMEAEKIYTGRVEYKGKIYHGFLDYLKNNMRGTVLGTKEKPTFANWWENKATLQLQYAFEDFGIKYQEIVVDMVQKLFTVPKAISNQGPAANAVIPSILQEEMAYLSVLQEIITPSRIYEFRLQDASETKIQDADLLEVHRQFLVMVNLLKTIRIVQKSPQEIFAEKNPELRAKLIKLASQKSSKMTVIESPLKNSDFSKQKEAISAALNKLAEKINAGAEPAGGIISEKRQSIDVTLQALAALSQEMANFGTIANAVSWDKLKETDLKIEQVQRSENTEKAMKGSQGATTLGR